MRYTISDIRVIPFLVILLLFQVQELQAQTFGEPTGSSPNYIGESNTLKLPYSKLYLIISNRYHQTGANTSFDKRKWYAPSVCIEPSSIDYKLNQDPVMNYIQEEVIKSNNRNK